jgi:DNA polymerase III gamma/tau subunit
MIEKQWTEKYRPNYFAEVKGQEEVVKKVREFIETFFSKR